MDADTLAAVAAGGLPWFWDSDSIALIRAVGLRSAGFFRNVQDGQDVIRTVYWRTVVPNATEAGVVCGTAPATPSRVARSRQIGSSGFHVRLEWDASTDDGSGDDDVTHYVVSVRLYAVSPAEWTPVATVPALGIASYRHEDYFPQVLGDVIYGVAAVDCGWNASAIAEHAAALTLPGYP
jgi:hypothetical protein